MSWGHYLLKVWFVVFMVSPVYQIPLYCSSYVFKFPLLRIKLLFPKSLMSISFTKTKGSYGQVRFALWYPISTYESVTNFILNALPNEPDTSCFYLYYLELSCSVVQIQPNKNLHLITTLKSILKFNKIYICKQIIWEIPLWEQED